MALVFAGVLLLPTSAIANHQFTDVPTSHLFHTDIAHAFGARITNGCTATQFCPDNPVTRGQMTAFLNRGLPRLSFGAVSGSSSGAAQNVGQVTITAGNVPGGFAYIVITATVDTYVNGAGCPCEATIGIFRGTSQVSPLMYMDMVATPSPIDSDTDDVATVIGLSIVQTDVPQTYHVSLRREAGTGVVNAYGTIIAEVFYFDGTGDPPGEEIPFAPFAEIGKPTP